MPTDYERAVYESDRMQREAIRQAHADGTLNQSRIEEISQEAIRRLRQIYAHYFPQPNYADTSSEKNS